MIPVETLLADHQLYHSDFQMDALITVRAGGTRYGCYKQSLRELWKRYRGLRDLYAQCELLRIDIDELSSRSCDTEIDQRRTAVQRASKQLALQEVEKNIEDTEREFLRFYNQAVVLKSCIGELDPKRRAELDCEMWEHRLRCAAAIDFMTSGRLSANTVESLQSCPVEMRKRLAADMLDPAKHGSLIEWFLSYSPDVPAFALSPATDVRRMVECSESSPSLTQSLISSPTDAIMSPESNITNGCESANLAIAGSA